MLLTTPNDAVDVSQDIGLSTALDKIPGLVKRLASTTPPPRLFPKNFSFRWAGYDFVGSTATIMAGATLAGTTLALTAVLGRLPFSAENLESRRTVKNVLSGPMQGGGAHYTLDKNDSLCLRSETLCEKDLTLEAGVHALAVILLQLRPALQQFDGLLIKA